MLRFLELLWAVVHGLERTSKRMSRDLGVTGPQRLVLRIVGLFPGLSAGDLARILHVHASTLTGVLQRLETQRLLQRVEHPDDRRRVILRLTKLGMRVNQVRTGTVESAVAAALAEVSERDRVVASRMLERITRHLEHGLEPAASAKQLPEARGRGRRRSPRQR